MFSIITFNLVDLVVLLVGLTLLIVYLYYHGSAHQDSIGQMRQLPALTAEDRVLVFSPHPDDETAAAGGYIYSARENGVSVRVVLATDGNQLGLGKQRYREFVGSLSQLGVPAQQLCCLGYPDTKLSRYKLELKTKIAEEIESFKPSVIICPSPDDLHSDHQILGKVILNLDPAARIYAYLVHYPWWPQMRLLAGNHHLLPPRRLANKLSWACFPLAAAAYDNRNIAFFLYKTQLLNPFIRPKLLRLLQGNELFAVIKEMSQS